MMQRAYLWAAVAVPVNQTIILFKVVPVVLVEELFSLQPSEQSPEMEALRLMVQWDKRPTQRMGLLLLEELEVMTERVVLELVEVFTLKTRLLCLPP
jgi:hypothetical protein